MPKQFKLGEFTIEVMQRTVIQQNGEQHQLQPKFIDVLLYLVEHYPDVVSRQELIDHIWSGNTHVGEKALTNAIWHLRKIFNQDDNIIETIRKTGYRLLLEPQFQPPLATVIKQKRYYVLFVVPLILFCWLSWQQFKPATPTKRQITNITTEPGLELYPSPSPDGRYLVYKWIRSDGQIDLFMRDLNKPGSDPIRLTRDRALEGQSVWNKDGRHVYFSKWDQQQQTCHVVKMNMQDYTHKPIADCSNSVNYRYLDLSPDGKKLAFYGDDPQNRHAGIYLLDLADENAPPKALPCNGMCDYNERDMVFSPDGRYLATTRRANRFSENIFLHNLKNHQVTQLTQGEQDIVGLSWHPDSKRLVYAVQRADRRTGYLIEINQPQRIIPLEIDGFSYPKFASHDTQLFFQHRLENYTISAFSLQPGKLHQATAVLRSIYNHKFPDYSPSRKKLAYLSNESGHYEVWIANPDGSSREQITNIGRSVLFPAWSHNGKYIAFLAPTEESDRSALWVVDVESKAIRVLPGYVPRYDRPFWSFDDNHIMTAAYHDSHADIYRYAVTNGQAERVTDNGGRYGMMLDANTLIYSTETQGLWRQDLTTGNKQQLLSDGDFNVSYPWVYHNHTVYLLQNNHDQQQLIAVDLNNGSKRVLLSAPKTSFGRYSALRLDRQNMRLYLTQIQLRQSDIKMLTDPLFE